MEAVAWVGMALAAADPTAPDARPRTFRAGSRIRSASRAPPPSVAARPNAARSSASASGASASAARSVPVAPRTSS